MPIIGNLSSKKTLLFFLVAAIFIFLASCYIASNYGAPQCITVRLKTEKDALFSVYYDVGKGYEEDYKIGQLVKGSSNFQVVKLRLSWKQIKSFRIDPLTEPGTVYIKSIKLSSYFNRQHLWTASDIPGSFRPGGDITRFEIADGSLLIESKGNDPYFEFTGSLPFINKVSAIELTLFIVFCLLVVFFFYSLMRVYFKRLSNFFSDLDIRNGYFLGFLAGFVLILNFQKLHLYFLSDDFVFLHAYQNLRDVFTASATYHLDPVTYFFIFYLGNRLIGLDPFYYHAVTLFLHIINVLLVYRLAYTLFRSKWISFASSLLFATYFMNYEVVYWVTGVFYILLTTFYISTLLFFVKYLDQRRTVYYSLFLATFTLALFTMEQGITLLGACIILELLLPANLDKLRLSTLKQKVLLLLSGSTKYLLPFVIIILFFTLKQSMQQTLIVNHQTYATFLKTVYGMVWHLFVPYPYGVSKDILYGTERWDYRLFLFIAISGITSYLFVRYLQKGDDSAADRRRIFGSDAAACFFLFICILSDVIPQSISTVMQARYFYLPSVFSSILLGSLLVKNMSYLIKNDSRMRIMLHSSVIVFIAAAIPINITFLHDQYQYWREASEITKNVIHDTEAHVPENVQGQNIYYVNLPDGVFGPKYFGWPNAYLFRNGISEAIQLEYPRLKIGVVKACRTNDGLTISREHQLMTNDELHQLALSKRNLVLVYDAEIKSVRILTHSDIL